MMETDNGYRVIGNAQVTDMSAELKSLDLDQLNKLGRDWLAVLENRNM